MKDFIIKGPFVYMKLNSQESYTKAFRLWRKLKKQGTYWICGNASSLYHQANEGSISDNEGKRMPTQGKQHAIPNHRPTKSNLREVSSSMSAAHVLHSSLISSAVIHFTKNSQEFNSMKEKQALKAMHPFIFLNVNVP